MQTRKLGDLEVSAVGLGCMSISSGYGPHFFEELTPEQIERQLTTNLVGPMNVTRAVLPVSASSARGRSC